MHQRLKPLPSKQAPTIFQLGNAEDRARLELLIEQGEIEYVSDHINRSIDELYHIQYPQQIDEVNQNSLQDFKQKFLPLDEYGAWVHFPWNKSIVHFPAQPDLLALRTSRNRNLVTSQEQQILAKATILVVGLSVGTSVVESLLLQGIGGTYILVDNDSLDPTNLNRIRASFAQIGTHKVDIAAQKISETDPYLQQIHYRQGLTKDNLDEIFARHQPDIVVDEMDNLELKILLRNKAKAHRKPVLMATDDGDDALIDIERYDQDQNYPVFHGQVPEEVLDFVLNNRAMTREQAGVIIGKYFVGLEYVPLRMIESLQQVGKSLPSWPQLGGAATISGVLVAYSAKKILLSQPLRSGKYLIGPDQSLNPLLEDEVYLNNLAKLRRDLTQALDDQ